MKNSIGQAKSLNISGVVLWDDHYQSASKQACQNTKSYVDTVLGPYVKSLLHDTSSSTYDF